MLIGRKRCRYTSVEPRLNYEVAKPMADGAPRWRKCYVHQAYVVDRRLSRHNLIASPVMPSRKYPAFSISSLNFIPDTISINQYPHGHRRELSDEIQTLIMSTCSS